MRTHGMRALMLAVSMAAVAHADEGAVDSFLGGGVGLSTPGPSALTGGDVCSQLTYGATDRLNWSGASHVIISSTNVQLFFTSVLEWIFFRSNHLRWSVGAGVGLGVPVPNPTVQLGPVLETALRWTVSWGFGLALSAHASWLFDLGQPARSGLLVAPVLSVFMEL